MIDEPLDREFGGSALGGVGNKRPRVIWPGPGPDERGRAEPTAEMIGAGMKVLLEHEPEWAA